MSVAGDFNVNSVQTSSDSFMEVVKETILKQDLMFRMQVHELHRVYRAQNFLVKDLGCRELYGRNSLSTIPQPPVFPLKDVTEYASPPDESRLYYTDKVALTTFSTQDLSENYKGKHHRFQKRPLDLQLSADEFININNAVEETPKNWIILDQSEGPMELSLGLREEKRRKRGTIGKWIDKATQPCYQNVIDLEDSDEQESDSCRKYAPLGKCASPSIYSKGDRDMVSLISPAMSLDEKKDPFAVLSKCLSTEEKIECYQVQASPSKGNREGHGVLHYHHSTEEQQPASGQGWKLDLNEPFVDDSSQDSPIPSLEYSPIVGSVSSSTGPIVAGIKEATCSTPTTEENLRCSNKASEIIQHTVKMDQTLDLDGKSKSTDLFPIENSKQSTELADGTTSPETMSISDGPGSCCTEQKNEDIDASKSRVIVSYLDDSDCKHTSAGVMCSEKSVNENIARPCTSRSQNGIEEGQGDKSPVSWKSCCTSDNDSSCAKSIQSGLQYAAQKGHPETISGSQFVDLLPDQHNRGTAYPEDATMKNIDQSEESREVQQRAAELLIQLSSWKNPSVDHHFCSKAGSKEIENKNGKEPQHPADSFERMVLQLPEDNIDDECTSSKPLVPNGTEAKDVGRKFRRGRRMKDFQKEILPTLASLSVQEIREDVNIFEGVLRSREYRRTTRAKMAAQDQDWSAAVKTSRRSKMNNVRRRIFA